MVRLKRQNLSFAGGGGGGGRGVAILSSHKIACSLPSAIHRVLVSTVAVQGEELEKGNRVFALPELFVHMSPGSLRS